MEIKLRNTLLSKRKSVLIFIMRSFIFLLCTTVFGFTTGDLLSQNTKIIVDTNKTVTVEEVFDMIDKQTDYSFVYKPNLFKELPTIRLKKGIIFVNKLLQKSLSAGSFNITINKNKTIFIKEKILKESSNLQKTITGIVTDANGQPLPGANILEKGTTNGVQSDFDGNFSLEISDENAVLVVSYLGFLMKEVPLNGQTTFTIELQEDAAKLDEVVVVGYGTLKKKDLTGSVGSVKGSDLEGVKTDGFSRSLTGRIAGVQIQQSTGTPGGSVSIKVRGLSSINASNEPLYVIDGFIVENSSAFNESGGGVTDGGVNPLNAINPQDIESIQVLKDASASAIYGSRGSNGVVIVTTKRGKTGKPQISFDAYSGVQNVLRKVDLLNSVQMKELFEDFDAKNTVDYSGFINSIDPSVDVDWQDRIFRQALVQNYNLSLKGGGENVKYFISGGYFNEEGIIENSDFTRYNLRANIDAKVSDRLSIGLSLSPSYSKSNVINAEGTGGGSTAQPIINATLGYYPFTEDMTQFAFDNGICCFNTNPEAAAKLLDAYVEHIRNIANLSAKVDITEDLQFKSTIGVDMNFFKTDQFQPTELFFLDILKVFNPNFARPSRGISSSVQDINLQNENTLTYKKEIGDHSFTVLGGLTYQVNTIKTSYLEKDQFTNDDVRTLNAATNVRDSYTLEEKWAINSLFGRINYNYNGKYLLSASIRRDGSSRFGKDTRYGIFPAVSGGWAISEEDFFKSSTISNLKLRASYGVTGNNRIGNYASIGLLSPSSYTFGSGNGSTVGAIEQTTIPNPDLGWETTNQFDIGLESSFFNNRINLIVDYYNSKTEDLLFQVPIASVSGFTSAIRNVGEIRNKGWEFAVSSKNFTGDFKWNTDFNISFNRNEVLSLGGDEEIFGNGGIANTHITVVGKPIGNIYGFNQIGIFQNQAEVDAGAQWENGGSSPGDVKFEDVDGNGVINDKDRTILGNNQPDFIWGFTNKFNYGSFDLSVVVNGVQGGELLDLNGRNYDISRPIRNQYAEVDGRWRSESNPGNGRTPRAVSNIAGNEAVSSRWVHDASFVRIQNLTLGYTLDKPLKGLQSLRLYGSVDNLAYFSDYKGYNPEVSGVSALTAGTDYGTYPLARRFSIGLSAKF